MSMYSIYKNSRYVDTLPYPNFKTAIKSNCGCEVVNVKRSRAEHRQILCDFGIWDKLSTAEKEQFENATTDYQINHLLVTFRKRYM